MSRPVKLLILIATLAPVPGSYMTLMATLRATGVEDIRHLFTRSAARSIITHGVNIDVPVWAFMLMGLLIWCVMMYVFYLVHITQNKEISSGEKQMWYLTLVLGHLLMPLNLIVMTRYWYAYVWRRPAGNVVYMPHDHPASGAA